MNLFATIGFIAILVVLIYYIWKYIDKMNRDAAIMKERPTPTYMDQVGVKCPDYWMYMGGDANGNYICKDSKNLMKKYGKSNNEKCVSSNSTVVFPKLDGKMSWGSMSDKEKIDFTASKVGTSYSRAEWIKNCGTSVGEGVNTRAVWSGFEKYI